MANTRNKKQDVIENDSEFYKELYERRGLKRIAHYETPIFRHPTISQRASITSVGYIWAYGDRFYKLANQYYGDKDLWWIIASANNQAESIYMIPGKEYRIPQDTGLIFQEFNELNS